MKKIYIASPYTLGDVAVNVRESLFVADELVKNQFVPFVPLLSHFWHLVSPKPYEVWLEYDLQWIESCDGLLRVGGKSEGADAEVEFAKEIGIPVFYSIEEVKKHYA